MTNVVTSSDSSYTVVADRKLGRCRKSNVTTRPLHGCSVLHRNTNTLNGSIMAQASAQGH
ncbi:predicted protein [Plenodomus lingam JN3]|uniref:Predicted protein n=1 Tax=Leptosphaeria maculans (strain JN3 / isolate v23.1.3 / race Av1-4-5-6-7-8) TaxID=985895 RepID=E5AA53_LEPMJ|nr:predicted protein [Plenodomus lingam JN3]CBY00544.1 predicted protein [Plenodomus lingam JN3]